MIHVHAALGRNIRSVAEGDYCNHEGWVRIIIRQTPAPKIDLFQESTRVTLFSGIPFSSISMEDTYKAA